MTGLMSGAEMPVAVRGCDRAVLFKHKPADGIAEVTHRQAHPGARAALTRPYPARHPGCRAGVAVRRHNASRRTARVRIHGGSRCANGPRYDDVGDSVHDARARHANAATGGARLSSLELMASVWSAGWVLALLSTPSVLLQRMGRPTAALSWLLALFAVPPLALPAWWLLGRTHLRARRARRRRAHSELEPRLESTSRAEPAPQQATPGLLDVVDLPGDLSSGVFPPSGGNHVCLLNDAASAYASWETAMDGAQHHIHALFYAWHADESGRRLRDRLVAAARRGVEVRLLYDDVGTPAPARFFQPLLEAGAKVAVFMPLRLAAIGPSINFRNHRKLLVVDGQAGFIGGLNVGDDYLRWRDLAIGAFGAAVEQMQEIFADDWYFTTGEDLAGPAYFGRWAEPRSEPPPPQAAPQVSCATVASGPTQRYNATREMLFLALTRARRRIWLMTPYLVPDPAVTTALRAARFRGVDVRILVPAVNDVWIVRRASRAYYPELLEAGIRLFEYPSMLHAKATLIDDDLLLIGSANMDSRSFRFNFEATCFLESGTLNAQFASLYEKDLEAAHEIRPGLPDERAWLSRVIDATAHLASPLL